MEQGISVWKSEVGGCSDSQLVMRVQHLARNDQNLVARLIVYIGEMDARGLCREHAFPSMFHYLVGELRMSEAEAFLRLQAARLARQYPVVIELLASGAVHLSALRLIAPLLTPDNHARLLQRVSGKTKREVMKIVADLAPKPEVRAQIRKLPQRRLPPFSGEDARAPLGSIEPFGADVGRASPTTHAVLPLVAAPGVSEPSISVARRDDAARSLETGGVASAENSLKGPQVPAALSAETAAQVVPEQVPPDDAAAFVLEAPREKKRGLCTPVGPDRYEMKLPVDQELYDTLEQLRHLLRHRVPDGDLTLIVARAAKHLLSHELKQRFAQIPARPSRRGSAKASSPAASGDASTSVEADVEASGTSTSDRQGNDNNSRYIPNEVKRQVYARDGGRCTFVSASGRRCSELGGVQLHHILAFALGGRATVDNLKLMCRAHNRLLAEHDFGQDFMRRKSAPEKRTLKRLNSVSLVTDSTSPRTSCSSGSADQHEEHETRAERDERTRRAAASRSR